MSMQRIALALIVLGAVAQLCLGRVDGGRAETGEDVSHQLGVLRRGLEAPSQVDLPFGDVNLVVVTDVHSWIAGHARHSSTMNADYGDVLSFYERLRKHAAQQKKDLFFVMNGDFVDGTGLSTTPPQFLTPLLEHMPWDVVNLGNHELYNTETVRWVVDEFIPHWGGNYLTTNTVMNATNEPMGNRFTYLKGEHSNSTILSFGFLYNFVGSCDIALVHRVQDVVQQDWFVEVVSKLDYDAILVMAHMHFSDGLVNVILDAIRAIAGSDMPVQFITGHSHIRAHQMMDEYSSSFEAGKYLDTVGFCSFPIKDRTASTANADAGVDTSGEQEATQPRFEHVFLDSNQQKLADVLHVDVLQTKGGMALTDKIHQTQEDMGLNRKIGCAAHEYRLNVPTSNPKSLFGLYIDKIIPTVLTNHSSELVFVQTTGALRYDLSKGTVLVDDVVIVSPFNDTVYNVSSNIQGQALLDALNIRLHKFASGSFMSSGWAIVTNGFDPSKMYTVYAPHFNAPDVRSRLETVTGKTLGPLQPLISNTTHVEVKTTHLWIDYIEQYWPCDGSADGASSSSWARFNIKQEAKPIVGGMLVGIALVGAWMYVKYTRKARLEYITVDATATEMEQPAETGDAEPNRIV